MTAKAALCKALLAGEVINIKNCVHLTGLTNAPREISRMIEQDFGVVVSRTPMKGKSRYGGKCVWHNYRLNATEHNHAGMRKMWEYVKQQEGNDPAKTNAQEKTEKAIKQTMNAVNYNPQPTLF